MAKAKTTSKTAQKATKTENVKKTATRSTAKKVTKSAATKTKPAATKTKPAAAKPKPSKPVAARKQKPSETAAKTTVDRRAKAGERRKNTDRRKKAEPVAAERRFIERRAKVCRRRQIDPTTCERDYTSEELEFMNAMDDYKRSSGRMFPTCSEVLEVIRDLGYEKRRKEMDVANEQTEQQPAELPTCRPTGQPAAAADEPRADWRAELMPGQTDERNDAEKIALTDGEHLVEQMHAAMPLDLEECKSSERVLF